MAAVNISVDQELITLPSHDTVKGRRPTNYLSIEITIPLAIVFFIVFAIAGFVLYKVNRSVPGNSLHSMNIGQQFKKVI